MLVASLRQVWKSARGELLAQSRKGGQGKRSRGDEGSREQSRERGGRIYF